MNQNRSVNDVNVFTWWIFVKKLTEFMDVTIRPWQDHLKHPTWDILFALNP